MKSAEPSGLRRKGSPRKIAPAEPDAAPRLIEWTGERCVPWADDLQMVYEHVHRYNFAVRFCAGKRVLDLACGEGYGSAILGSAARQVVGVDIDPLTVEHARLNYGSDTVQFLEGSMLDGGPYADGSYDVVVCYEAIEHIEEHEQLLDIVRRCLREGGIAIISTPDRTVYTEESGQRNPFHVHELNAAELRGLLSRRFKNVALLSQQVEAGSVMQRIPHLQRGGCEVIHVYGGEGGWTRREPNGAPYLVAIASNGAIADVPVQSTLIDVDLLLVRSVERRAANLAGAVQQRDADVAELHTEMQRVAATVSRLQAEVEQADQRLMEAQQAARLVAEATRLERLRRDAHIDRLEASVRYLVKEAAESRTAHQADIAALEQERELARHLTGEVGSIKASKGWRAVTQFRRVYHGARHLPISVAGRVTGGRGPR